MKPQVVVIGGGPAGAATALTLARAGVSVIIFEKETSSGWKIGEGLPPAARPMLQQLGVWERFVADGHLPSYGNCSAWGSGELVDHSFVFNPHGNGWHLDRSRFDRMLLDAAIEAGAQVFSDITVTDVQRMNSGWRLELGRNQFTAEAQRTQRPRRDSEETLCEPSATLCASAVKKDDLMEPISSPADALSADFVVDASGRNSWFARRQGARRINHDNLVGVAALLIAGGEVADRDSLTMVEAVADGWWYAALLPDEKLVAVFLSDADLEVTRQAATVQGWRSLLAETEHLRKRVERHGYQIELAPHLISANSSRLDVVAGNSWLAVGDAAAAFDPLSSQGIVTALEFGILTAEAILAGEREALKTYSERLEQKFAAYLANRNFYYSQERRWPASTFWRRRHSAS
ncbi:MAG: FAD-dependent oxidoreductase [Acidobacteriota bacterium]|nr:FAD-dependent oxidoreductase [Acidobacteriota bacterium]